MRSLRRMIINWKKPLILKARQETQQLVKRQGCHQYNLGGQSHFHLAVKIKKLAVPAINHTDHYVNIGIR